MSGKTYKKGDKVRSIDRDNILGHIMGNVEHVYVLKWWSKSKQQWTYQAATLTDWWPGKEDHLRSPSFIWKPE